MNREEVRAVYRKQAKTAGCTCDPEIRLAEIIAFVGEKTVHSWEADVLHDDECRLLMAIRADLN